MREIADSEGPKPIEYMLTTMDNPYDPFNEWDSWYMWDLNAGYNTPGLLARISTVASDSSEADQYHAVQDAIDEIVRENVSGVHQKMKRGDTVVVTQIPPAPPT